MRIAGPCARNSYQGRNLLSMVWAEMECIRWWKSIYVTTCLCVCVCVSISLPINLTVCVSLSIWLSVFICFWICFFIYLLSANLSVSCLFVNLAICSVSLSMCVCVYLSVCLSVCVYVSVCMCVYLSVSRFYIVLLSDLCGVSIVRFMWCVNCPIYVFCLLSDLSGVSTVWCLF